MNELIIRIADLNDLDGINHLRKQVHEVHVSGRPDMFRADGWNAIKPTTEKYILEGSGYFIIAAIGDEVVGYVQVEPLHTLNHPVLADPHTYHIKEFGVSEQHRRKGIATRLMEYAKSDAVKNGFHRIDLSVWEFNETALKFYESMSMKTYKRHLELFPD